MYNYHKFLITLEVSIFDIDIWSATALPDTRIEHKLRVYMLKSEELGCNLGLIMQLNANWGLIRETEINYAAGFTNRIH